MNANCGERWQLLGSGGERRARQETSGEPIDGEDRDGSEKAIEVRLAEAHRALAGLEQRQLGRRHRHDDDRVALLPPCRTGFGVERVKLRHRVRRLRETRSCREGLGERDVEPSRTTHSVATVAAAGA